MCGYLLHRRLIFAVAILYAFACGSAHASSFRLQVFTFVDHSRLAHYRNGVARPRRLVTYVRIPDVGPGPHPLLVFAHGFQTNPASYARLLDALADAGFVVAAPVFPVEARGAPGGPDEDDLINQPRDVSFVITRLLVTLRGLVDPARIAVAGQSDGGETALAVADDRRFHDPRIRAAVVLAGAEMGGFSWSARTPPLLAIQGTADPVNPPEATYSFFAAAPRPKFLVRLLGAGHLPPFTSSGRQLGVVERVVIAFLHRYLDGAPLGRMLTAGNAAGIARLSADP